ITRSENNVVRKLIVMNCIDIIGCTLWVVMFITPLCTIPLTWKIFENKIYSIIVRLMLACNASFLVFLSASRLFSEMEWALNRF
ncbi:MAG: hypothetical protein M3R17_17065, partial [Bacteroidota bacterium]|nr:hypothetical protein [Bacteroidota bacterium]